MHLSLVITVAAAQFGGQVSETELWCVAKNNAEDSALKTAIDWACGPGGADCAGIQQGGPCYDPSDILNMASYVFNNYYLKNGPADEACDFSNNAALTSLNPSQGICIFPSSKKVSNGDIVDTTTSTQGTTAQEYSDFSGARRIFKQLVVDIHHFRPHCDHDTDKSSSLATAWLLKVTEQDIDGYYKKVYPLDAVLDNPEEEPED